MLGRCFVRKYVLLEDRRKMFKRSAPQSKPVQPDGVAIDALVRAFDAAAVRGRRGSWGARLNAQDFDPSLTPLAEAFNGILDTIERRQTWYEAILDSVPFLLSVTDMDMNWTFVNKPVEELAGTTRKELAGKHCTNLRAPSCATKECGVETLRRGEVRSKFELDGHNMQIETTYVVDRTGNRLGHMEVIQDTTALVRAASYQQTEAARMAGYLNRLADGDLSFAPEVSPGDEHTAQARANFVQIADGMSRTLTNLRELIGEVQASANDVASAGSQIQAASEQSANATQDVAATVQRVAADAQGSTEATTSVSQIAESGRATVDQTVDAMRSIDATVAETGASIREMRDRSDRIGAIVETIDEIASQTNLLALNAAIEAARAGEHGRGFAVVADEVRKLADRSSQATREIGELIRDVQLGIQSASQAMERSVEQVSAGTNLATAAGGALGRIAEAASRSVEQAQRIASDAAGVASATEEMSAQVQELSASAQTLAEVSAQLKAQSGRFVLQSSAAPIPFRRAA
jgi:methyl-accepting chemotaxis protein